MSNLFPSKVGQFPAELGVSCDVGFLDIAGYSLETFQNLQPTNYTILCRFSDCMGSLNYFPGSRNIVINCENTSRVLGKLPHFVPNVAKDLGINEAEASNAIQSFFYDKNLVVQPVGIQAKVYHVMRNLQTYAPLASMSQAVTTAKTIGLTGTKVITQAPLTFVGATYIGSIFFAYAGTVAGNNTVGLVCNTTSYVLSRPMRGVEMVLNGLILTPISNTVGLPLMLNGTSELTSGFGIKLTEYGKVAFAFERILNSTWVQKIKKVYQTVVE